MEYNFDGLISITSLAAIRHLAGLPCATEQGIRAQIRQLAAGEKTSQDVGFEIVKSPTNAIFLKLTNPEMETFRLKINKYARANAPTI